MVESVLNEKLIAAGKQLVEQLDAAGITADAALWFRFSDIEAWKLLISLPELIKQGPKSAYRELQKALAKLGEDFPISLNDIAVAKADSPLLRLLGTAVKTGPGISQIRFSSNVVNGQFIEDALIYRLTSRRKAGTKASPTETRP